MVKLDLRQSERVCAGKGLFSVKLSTRTARYCVFWGDSEEPLDCFDSLDMAFSYGDFLTLKRRELEMCQRRFGCSFEDAVRSVVGVQKAPITKFYLGGRR